MGARQSTAAKKALRLVAAGATPHAAAIKCGISPSAIYRALDRAKALYAAPAKQKTVISINELDCEMGG